MVPNQRADSSACLSLRSLRSLRLNEARFNSLEADPAGRYLGAVVARGSRGLLSPALLPRRRGRSARAARRVAGPIGTPDSFSSPGVPEIRRPKVEGRKKAENRSPKPESPSASGFGLRFSELGLLSALGFRASDFNATSLLTAARRRRC